MTEDPSAYRGRTGDGLHQLWNTVRQLQREVAALQGDAPLRSAGIGVDEDGMTIDSSLTVNGRLAATGDIESSGNLIATGNLSLREGIIEGAALAEQISAGGSSASASGFSVTGSGWRTLAQTTVPVPSWATQAIAIATGSFLIHDTQTGGLAFCRGRVGLGANYGQAQIAPVTIGASIAPSQITLTHVRNYTLASGTTSLTVTLQAEPSNTSAYPSFTDNAAQVNAVALFLRGG